MKTTTKKAFDLKTSYIGTCQACFNQQVVKATAGETDHTMVLHGYERPGFGYIVGDCRGVKEIPYELSCEFTKKWKGMVEFMLADAEEKHAELLADKVESFLITLIDYEAPHRGFGTRPLKSLTVKRDWAGDARNGYGGGYRGETPFQQVRANRLREMERGIESLKNTISFLVERIAAWKYAPEALKDHETVKREAREAVEQNRLAAGFRRNWKDLWKYVAEAINTHKGNQESADDLQTEESKKSFARWENPAEGEKRRRDLIADYTKKLTVVGRFPTNKERAAARKGMK